MLEMQATVKQGYYSAHGDAANLVAEHLYKSTALVKTLGRGDATLLGAHGTLTRAHLPTPSPPGVTFGSHMLPNILHWLLVQQGQYRVEMYEGSGSSWECTKYVRTHNPCQRHSSCQDGIPWSPG